ncbi:MAG: asparagine synthetase B, partial [Dehalococcoidia bacterium]|nr:asparagine synthetase B [Dehalococcoidia bacterium]
MCGIAGAASRSMDKAIDEPQLRSMLGKIVHRGPDDEGVYLDACGAIGVRRLSIIDVQGGHQPVHNEDERLWVVLNGEVYNFKELYEQLTRLGHRFYTRSDTEVIVHAYEEWGDSCVDHLNGMFAFAVWDAKTQRLFIARDRAGMKPLYYCQYDGRLAFASELKALLALRDIPRELDLISLNLYLTYEHVPTPRTILKGICKLP